MSLDFDQAFARLSADFVDSTKDRLDEIDNAIEAIYSGIGDHSELFYELRRHLHSVKGSAGSYGFHLVSIIAHRAEDYIESSVHLDKPQWLDVQIFIDQMRTILDTEADPGADQYNLFLAGLPTTAQQGFTDQNARQVTVILVMPSGVQRTLVSSELTSCGFDVSYADHPIRALELMLAIKPDAALSNMELPVVSGVELAHMLSVTAAGSDIPFALMTSHQDLDAVRAKLPPNVGIVSKNKSFLENLTAYLMELGLFGQLREDVVRSA